MKKMTYIMAGLLVACFVFCSQNLQAQNKKNCAKVCSKSTSLMSSHLATTADFQKLSVSSEMTKEECAKICKYICGYEGSLTSQNAGISPLTGTVTSNKQYLAPSLQENGKKVNLIRDNSGFKPVKKCSRSTAKTKTAKA